MDSPEQSCLPNNTASRRVACGICQCLPEDFSREDFKDAHGFSNDWSFEAESVEERFRVIEASTAHLLEEYQDMAAYNRICLRPEHRARRSRDELELLFRNHARFNEYRRTQRMAREQQRGQFIDDGTDSSQVTMPVKLYVDIFDETSVTIHICEARFVQGGRWYLGHRPGTYIFRYSGSQGIGSGLNTYMGAPGYIVPGDFEYMGQVPRLEKEHKERLWPLFRGVLRLFISELRLFAGLHHQDSYPELEGLLQLENVETALHFYGVWEHWRNAHVLEVEWPNAEMRRNFVSHPKIQELAWYLNSFKSMYSGEGQEPEPLEKLIVNATNKELHDLARLWRESEMKLAWNMLKSGNRKGLFIYEATSETEDIHNFYRQAPFNNDPLNPAVIHSYKPLELIPVSPQEFYATGSDDLDGSTA